MNQTELIRHVIDSLDPTYWNGTIRLTSKGDKVFDREKDATQKLKELLNSKKSNIPDALLLGWINTLINVDKQLAQVAIKDATNTPGADAKKLADAAKSMAEGADNLSKGKYPQAIDDYRNAWKKAMEAVKKL